MCQYFSTCNEPLLALGDEYLEGNYHGIQQWWRQHRQKAAEAKIANGLWSYFDNFDMRMNVNSDLKESCGTDRHRYSYVDNIHNAVPTRNADHTLSSVLREVTLVQPWTE